MSRTILVVDDERNIVELARMYLRNEGFEVETAYNGREGLEKARQLQPALVLLDIMMPELDGLEVARTLRKESDIPLVMLTARGEVMDRVVGLELGADDYLPKPCSPRELLARTKAVLRRRREGVSTETAASAIEFDGWSLDLVRRELRSAAGVVVNLSGGEFHLLRVLVERPGRVLSRDQLLDLARGPTSEAFDRAIDVQISRLRKKLGLDGSKGWKLVPVYGVGYRFERTEPA